MLTVHAFQSRSTRSLSTLLVKDANSFPDRDWRPRRGSQLAGPLSQCSTVRSHDWVECVALRPLIENSPWGESWASQETAREKEGVLPEGVVTMRGCHLLRGHLPSQPRAPSPGCRQGQGRESTS